MTDATLQLIIRLRDLASAGVASLRDTLRGAGEQARAAAASVSATLGGALQQLGALAGGAALAGLVALGGGLGAVVAYGNQSAAAVRDLQAQLGLTRDQAEALGAVGEQVFAANWYDSIGEATAAVGLIRQQLGAMEDDLLRQVAGGVAAVSDTFGAEAPEIVAAVKAIRDNFPGTSEQQALDLITSGFQRGLNASGDLIGSITEYATQFGNSGASAGQFFSILETGLGTGVLGTDKASDLLKEFVVRIQDGSDLTRDSLTALGIDADRVLADLASGTRQPIDAFNQVLGALRATDSQAVLMQAGVGLLGTQFEDLGASAVLAIDTSATSLDALAGATASLNVRYESLSAVGQTLWRNLLIAGQPVYDLLLDLANQAMPPVLDRLEQLRPTIETATAAIRTFSGDVERANSSSGLGGVTGLIQAQVTTTGTALRTRLLGALEAARTGLVANATALASWATGLGPRLVAGLEVGLGQVLTWAQAAGPRLATQASGWASALTAWATDRGPALRAQLEQILAVVLAWVAAGRAALAAQLATWGPALLAWIQAEGPGAVAALNAWLGTVLAWVGAQLPALLGGFVGWRLALAQWVLDALPFLLSSLGLLLATLISGIGAALPPLIDALHAWSLVFLAMIAAAAPGLLAGLGALIGQVLDALGGALPGVVEALARWAAALVAWAIDAAPGLLAELLNLLGQMLAWIAARVPDIAAQLGTWALALIAWVGPAIPDLITALGDMLGLLLAWIVDNGPSIVATLAAWAAAFGQWAVESGLPALGGALLSIAAGLWDSIKDRWNQAFAAGSVGEALVTNIKNGILAAWDGFKAWLLDLLVAAIPGASIALSAAGALGGSGGGTPPLPGFATGVTDFSGGLAYVHAGELLVNMPRGTDVIPAPQVNRALAGSGGGGTTIVIENLSLPSVRDAAGFRDELNAIARRNGDEQR